MNPIRQYRKKPVVITAWQTDAEMYIKTLEGEMHASPGDWIITGVNGEQYPCKPDIFAKTYEPADLEPTPDAKVLARTIYALASQGVDEWLHKFEEQAAQLIAAHDNSLLDEAAERGVGWFTGHGSDPDELAEELRAAIKGAAHE